MMPHERDGSTLRHFDRIDTLARENCSGKYEYGRAKRHHYRMTNADGREGVQA